MLDIIISLECSQIIIMGFSFASIPLIIGWGIGRMISIFQDEQNKKSITFYNQ